MSPPPSASPKLHDLSSAPYSKGVASPGPRPLGLQRPAGGLLAGQEAPRPMGVHPSTPQPPPPALLQPQVSAPPSHRRSPGRQPALCPSSPRSALPAGIQEPTCLQSCSPTHPPGTGRQQLQLPKVPEKDSAATGPLPLPEARDDRNHSLAPIPVSVKREPQELDQLYLDDGECPRPPLRARRGARAGGSSCRRGRPCACMVSPHSVQLGSVTRPSSRCCPRHVVPTTLARTSDARACGLGASEGPHGRGRRSPAAGHVPVQTVRNKGQTWWRFACAAAGRPSCSDGPVGRSAPHGTQHGPRTAVRDVPWAVGHVACPWDTADGCNGLRTTVSVM